MSVQEQVGQEKWVKLLNAASAASAYVSTASGGGFESISELLTAGKFSANLARQTGGSGYGELVDEILAAMKEMNLQDARENRIQYQSRDPEGIRAELKQYIADAVAISQTLPNSEGYRRWILEMAREVAETKTGGFLGIGSKSVVDEKEQAAIDELSALLSV